MADEILKRDPNHVTVLAGVTDDVNQDVAMLRVDPTSKRLLVSVATTPGGITGSGVAGQVTYWSGVSSITGNANFTYDPITIFDVRVDDGTNDVYVNLNTSGSAQLGVSGIADSSRVIVSPEKVTLQGSDQTYIASPELWSEASLNIFGAGEASALPVNVVVRAANAAGTDIPGGRMTITGGQSTGNAQGGDIRMGVSLAGVNGTQLNPVLTRFIMNGSDGGVTVGDAVMLSAVIGIEPSNQTIKNYSTSFLVRNSSDEDTLTVNTSTRTVVMGNLSTGDLFSVDGDNKVISGGMAVGDNQMTFSFTSAAVAFDLVDVNAGFGYHAYGETPLYHDIYNDYAEFVWFRDNTAYEGVFASMIDSSDTDYDWLSGFKDANLGNPQAFLGYRNNATLDGSYVEANKTVTSMAWRSNSSAEEFQVSVSNGLVQMSATDSTNSAAISVQSGDIVIGADNFLQVIASLQTYGGAQRFIPFSAAPDDDIVMDTDDNYVYYFGQPDSATISAFLPSAPLTGMLKIVKNLQHATVDYPLILDGNGFTIDGEFSMTVQSGNTIAVIWNDDLGQWNVIGQYRRTNEMFNDRFQTVNYGTTPIMGEHVYHVLVSGAGTGVTTIDMNSNALRIGHIVHITDLDNKANANNIEIDAGTGNLISYNGAQNQIATITTNGGSFMLQKVSATLWVVI